MAAATVGAAVITGLATASTSRWAMKAGSKVKELVQSKRGRSEVERTIEGILEGMSGTDLRVLSLSGYGIPDGWVGDLIQVCGTESRAKELFLSSRILSARSITDFYGESIIGRDSVETITEAYLGEPNLNAISMSNLTCFGDSDLVRTEFYTATSSKGHIYLNDNTEEETSIAAVCKCSSGASTVASISALAVVYNDDGSVVLVSTGNEGYSAECLCKNCSSQDKQLAVTTLWGVISGTRLEVWLSMHFIASVMAAKGPNFFQQNYMPVVIGKVSKMIHAEKERAYEAGELFESSKNNPPVKNTIQDLRLAISVSKKDQAMFKDRMRMFTEVDYASDEEIQANFLSPVFPGESTKWREEILAVFKKLTQKIVAVKGPFGGKEHGSEVVATMFLAHMQASALRKMDRPKKEEVVVQGVEREMSKRKVNILVGNGFYGVYRYGSEGLVCAVDMLEAPDFEVYFPSIFRKLRVSNPLMLQLSVLQAFLSQAHMDDTDASKFLSTSVWSAFRAGEWAISKYGDKFALRSQLCYAELVCPEEERCVLHRDIIEMLVEKGYTPTAYVKGLDCFVDTAIHIARPAINMKRKIVMDRGVSIEACSSIIIDTELYVLGRSVAVRARKIEDGEEMKGSIWGYPIASEARVVHLEKNDQREIEDDLSLGNRGVQVESEPFEVYWIKKCIAK